MRSFLLLASILFSLAVPVAATAQETAFLVEPQMITDQKAVIATVESVHEVQARARIGGTIAALLVKEGDPVKANDKLAVIGDAKLAIRGKGLDAKTQGAESNYEKAKIDFDRAQELRKSGYGTQAKLDEAQNNLTVAHNALLTAQAERQEVSQQSSEGVVLAPSAGRVLKVPVAIGSVVMAGETIATLSQQDYVLRLELPESHARFLKPGDKVEICGRGLQPVQDDEKKVGIIRLVYPEIKNGRVIADVTAPDLGNYFVGERTRVNISAGARHGYLIPKDYVYRRANLHFVRLKNGQEVVIQKGQTNGDKIEVLTGLTAGDEVVKP